MAATLRQVTEDELRQRLVGRARLFSVEAQHGELADTSAEELVLRDCRFTDMNFSRVDWRGVRCTGTTFIRCKFAGAKMEGATFKRCIFADDDATGSADFTGASLRFSTFADCVLDGCVFERADLTGWTLRDSRAIGGKFHQAEFAGSATLTGNALRYADLRDAKLAHCDCSRNDCEWAVLDGADFEEANLRETSFNRASVRLANFNGADLRNAVIGSFDLRQTSLRRAMIHESQMRALLESFELVIVPDDHV